MRGVVFAAGARVFAEKNILVSVHDLNAPMFAIEVQQVLRRSLDFGQAGNQIDRFFFRWKPLTFLLALNDAANAADLLNRWPIILDVGGLDRQNVDDASLDPAVRFSGSAVVFFEGEKPAL